MIDLYLKKVFSTPACRWYPDSFFHWRRALVHESETCRRILRFGGSGSGADCEGLWPTDLKHLVEDVAGDDRFRLL
jgi:hypothetical protein